VKNEIVSNTDFEKDMLVYIASGIKPTGGYSVLVKKVLLNTNKNQLEVHALDREPKDRFGTMATTQPFTVLRVPKKQFEKSKVLWAKKRSNRK
jgi:hypothetical protein